MSVLSIVGERGAMLPFNEENGGWEQPPKSDHLFPLVFEQFSLCQMDKKGNNAFGVKKLGHLIVFILCEIECFRFIFFKYIAV